MQYPGPQGGHFEHLFIGDFIELARLGNDTRIGGVNAVHVGEYVAPLRPQGGGQGDGGDIGPAPAQRGDAIVGADALETGNHRHLAVIEAPADFGRVDPLDAGPAMGRIGVDRHLPAEPRTGADPKVLQRHRQEPAGDLLSGGDDDIVFAGVVEVRDLAGPIDQMVGDAGHGGNHDGHLVAGVDLRLHVLGHGLDTADVGDRSAAEFLNDACHFDFPGRGAPAVSGQSA